MLPEQLHALTMTNIDLRAVKSCAGFIKEAGRLAKGLAETSRELIPTLGPLLADLSRARMELRQIEQRDAKRQARRAERKRRMPS